MAECINEDEVLSCVMTSLAVAPLLDMASDMDIQDLLCSMKHILLQFYEDTVSCEAIQVPLLTFNRIDPSVIPLKTLTLTFSDLWYSPEINRAKLLDKFFEILPTFESFRENFAYDYDLTEFLAMILNMMIVELNTVKLEEAEIDLKLHDYLLNMFYITLEQDWEILSSKWNVRVQLLEKQMVYIIAAHSHLKHASSDKTLKQLIGTITTSYPKIDFNILLELGKEYRLKWSKEKRHRNDQIRSLLFDPDQHTGSILEGILVDNIIPLSDKICSLRVPSAVFHWLTTHTRYPYIGMHLDKLIPPALQLLSSSVDENKIVAIKCLSHIIDHSGRSELQLLNHDQVLYSELLRLTDHGNTSVVELAIPCTLTLLLLTTDPPHKAAELWRPNLYDRYLLVYLDAMGMENKYDRKHVYVKHLETIIQRCGAGIIKHLKSIVTIIIEYMKYGDDKDDLTRFHCIKCLKLLLENAWPRINSHSIDLLMCFVNVAATTHDSKNTKLYNEGRDFVYMLKVFCKGSLDKHLECLRSFNNKGVQEMVVYVFEK